MSAIDELVANARGLAQDHDARELPPQPALRVAIVTCMDARVNPYALLGLREGDAHIIRNAGGVITDDEIRSLTISQRQLGTKEIMLIHHTDCGLLTLSEDEFRRELEADAGSAPSWSVEAFDDLEEDVRRSVARVKTSPFIPHTDDVRGFVYDVHSGRLREVL